MHRVKYKYIIHHKQRKDMSGIWGMFYYTILSQISATFSTYPNTNAMFDVNKRIIIELSLIRLYQPPSFSPPVSETELPIITFVSFKIDRVDFEAKHETENISTSKCFGMRELARKYMPPIV